MLGSNRLSLIQFLPVALLKFCPKVVLTSDIKIDAFIWSLEYLQH